MKKIVLSIGVLVAMIPLPANAVKRVYFPDATSLQPMPEVAHPAISENVQRTSSGVRSTNNESFEIATVSADQPLVSAESNQLTNDAPLESGTGENGIWFFVLVGGACVAVAALVRKFLA